MRFDELPRIQGVIVDVDALRGISHRCDPGLCTDSPCCGAGYEVCIDEDEIGKVVGAMPLAARYVPHLMTETGPDNILDEILPGLHAIDTDDEGRCLFAYQGRGGAVLCSLHSAALAEGLDVGQVKPRSCMLWPLAMSGSRPRYLSVDPGAFDFPCNRRRGPGESGLDAGIADIVRELLGQEFLAEVEGLLNSTRGG